jgi:hypothetical protein
LSGWIVFVGRGEITGCGDQRYICVSDESEFVRQITGDPRITSSERKKHR